MGEFVIPIVGSTIAAVLAGVILYYLLPPPPARHHEPQTSDRRLKLAFSFLDSIDNSPEAKTAKHLQVMVLGAVILIVVMLMSPGLNASAVNQFVSLGSLALVMGMPALVLMEISLRWRIKKYFADLNLTKIDLIDIRTAAEANRWKNVKPYVVKAAKKLMNIQQSS